MVLHNSHLLYCIIMLSAFRVFISLCMYASTTTIHTHHRQTDIHMRTYLQTKTRIRTHAHTTATHTRTHTRTLCLSNLDSHTATAKQDVDRLHHFSHDHPGCHGHKVVIKGLGHEGEGTRHSRVALDHLQLVVLQM